MKMNPSKVSKTIAAQSKHYESVGDAMKSGSNGQLRAYCAAQNHLQYHLPEYMDDLKRLQNKIIKTLEASSSSERSIF